jgi:hypothetical protein
MYTVIPVTFIRSKRQGFSSIQRTHLLSTEGYTQPIVKTGFEYVVAEKVDSNFAWTAKQNGKVTKVTNKGMIIQYDDGTVTGLPLGRQFGHAEGSVYPHDLVTRFKEGDSFNRGEVLTYHEGFFEPDSLDPSKMCLKFSIPATVALYESLQTFEDSCALSSSFAGKLGTKVTKVKNYIVDFKQNVHNVFKEGSSITHDDVLMTLEDEITSQGKFSDADLALLQKLSNFAPRSGYDGVLDKIEVYYHGDKDDMTASLKTLADASDKKMASERKSIGKPVMSGSVNEEYHIAGDPLTLNKAEIKFYITTYVGTGVGD